MTNTFHNLGRAGLILTGLTILLGISITSVSGNGIPIQPIQPITPIYPNFTLDPIPPVTNISLSGTEGENGWFTSDVTVTLEASDNWAGVNKTLYSVFRENQQMGLLLSYSGPFKITYEGRSRVNYHSIDNWKNVEETKTETIMIDKTEPEGSLSIDGEPDYVSDTDVSLSLSATDATSGVGEMRFKNSGGSWEPWEGYSSSKDWDLDSGDGEKEVMAQFKDEAGLVSATYQATVVLDTSPPEISPDIENGTVTRDTTVNLSWGATDDGSGVDHYEVRVDGGSWKDIGTDTSRSFEGLEGGKHTFEIKAVDNVGRSQTYLLELTVNKTPIGGPSLLEEILIIVLIAAVVAGVVIFWLMKRPKKPPKPTRIGLSAEPKEIVADGKSTSTITVQLLDDKGEPVSAPADLQATLNASSGKLVNPVVKISQGSDSGTAVLGSSTKFGAVNVSVEAEDLAPGSITVTFKEKPRFCMGCGSRMPVGQTRCENCGASPSQFAGPETKTCHCGAVLPYTASYCSECGAKQSPAGEFSGQGGSQGSGE